jgi:hypothetical protein
MIVPHTTPKPIFTEKLPRIPGCYILSVRPEACRELGDELVGPSCVLYVGKAGDSIESRVQGAHMISGRSGISTLRRSLGALLREALEMRPVPRSTNPGDVHRFQNYAFDMDGEQRLSAWILQNVLAAGITSSSPADTEHELIRELQPPLNLTGWNNPQRNRIKAARAVCARLAAAQCSGSHRG